MKSLVKRAARVFFVDTIYQQMARRPGGVPRDKAIKQAQTNIDELKPEFAGWLEAELHELGEAIGSAHGNPVDAACLRRAQSSSRRLRDVGATLGYELITFIASNLCEILEVSGSGTSHVKNVVECHVDALRLASKEPYRNLRPDQLPEMASGLRQLVDRLRGMRPLKTGSPPQPVWDS